MVLWSVEVTHLTTVRPMWERRTCLGVGAAVGASVGAETGSLRIVTGSSFQTVARPRS